jgi:hypothetical protein
VVRVGVMPEQRIERTQKFQEEQVIPLILPLPLTLPITLTLPLTLALTSPTPNPDSGFNLINHDHNPNRQGVLNSTLTLTFLRLQWPCTENTIE